MVSSAVAGGASQAVQTISINGQQYQIVSPAPIGKTIVPDLKISNLSLLNVDSLLSSLNLFYQMI